MINNRQQNGRRRGRGGGNSNPRQGGGGGGGQGRADSGNRIDSRARGNANQLYEKYKNLARDAQMSGDRVNIEYYLQYADHYFRVLADSRSRFEDTNQPRRQQPFDIDGDDDDDNNEGEPIRSGEQNGARDDHRDGGRDGNRDAGRDGNRDGGRETQRDGNRSDNDRPMRGQRRDRPEANRAEGNRTEGNRDDTAHRDTTQDDQRSPRLARSDGDDRPQRPRRERADRDDRPQQADRVASPQSDRPQPERVQPQASPVDSASLDGDEAPAPRRRGRPRKEQPVDEAPAAITADRLPPSLGLSASSGDESDDEPKPRRRRIVRPVSDAPTAAE